MYAFFFGLHISWEKFGLLADLFHLAVKRLVKGVDANFGVLPEVHATDETLRHIHDYKQLVGFEQLGNRAVGGEQVHGTIHGFHDGVRWGLYLALVPLRLSLLRSPSAEIICALAIAMSSGRNPRSARFLAASEAAMVPCDAERACW